MKSTKSRRVAAIGALAGIALATCVIPQAASAAPDGIDFAITSFGLFDSQGRSLDPSPEGGDGYLDGTGHIRYSVDQISGDTIEARTSLVNHSGRTVSADELFLDTVGDSAAVWVVGAGLEGDVVTFGDQIPSQVAAGATVEIAVALPAPNRDFTAHASFDPSGPEGEVDINRANNTQFIRADFMAASIRTTSIAPHTAIPGTVRKVAVEVENRTATALALGADVAVDAYTTTGELVTFDDPLTVLEPRGVTTVTGTLPADFFGTHELDVALTDLRVNRQLGSGSSPYEVTDEAAITDVFIEALEPLAADGEPGIEREFDLEIKAGGDHPLVTGEDIDVRFHDSEIGDLGTGPDLIAVWPDSITPIPVPPVTPREVGTHSLTATIIDHATGVTLDERTTTYEVTASADDEPVDTLTLDDVRINPVSAVADTERTVTLEVTSGYGTDLTDDNLTVLITDEATGNLIELSDAIALAQGATESLTAKFAPTTVGAYNLAVEIRDRETDDTLAEGGAEYVVTDIASVVVPEPTPEPEQPVSEPDPSPDMPTPEQPIVTPENDPVETPDEPAAPAESVPPAETPEPDAPIELAEPVLPTSPAEPAEPGAPAESPEPEVPIQPAPPIETSEPEAPGLPALPAEPEDPEETPAPDQPAPTPDAPEPTPEPDEPTLEEPAPAPEAPEQAEASALLPTGGSTYGTLIAISAASILVGLGAAVTALVRRLRRA